MGGCCATNGGGCCMRWWRWGGERDGVKTVVGLSGLRCWRRGRGKNGAWRRSGSGGSEYMELWGVFWSCGKNPPENFSGGGCSRWPVVGESPEKMSGEGDVSGKTKKLHNYCMLVLHAQRFAFVFLAWDFPAVSPISATLIQARSKSAPLQISPSVQVLGF
ncbi:hypothetical protein Tco_1494013 [Tanacetum coccineum]